MKTTLKLLTMFLALLIFSCGGKEEKKKEGFSVERTKTTEQPKETPKATTVKASERVELDNKGVGPIKSVTLDAEINQALVAEGEDVYKKMCTACHRVDKKFIGPAPTGILTRRSPEWVMNMIMNPEGMISEDPLAKDLLMEFNGAPMANQSLTEDQTRAILEYFRTL